MKRLWLSSVLLMASITCQAQVRFVFDGETGRIGETSPQSFVLDLPGYLLGDQTFDAGTLESCAVVIQICSSIGFRQTDLNQPGLSVIDFTAGTTTTHYYFAGGAFTRPGQYQTVYFDLFNPAVLTVIGPPVPEPSPAVLFLSGLVSLQLVRRARRPAQH